MYFSLAFNFNRVSLKNQSRDILTGPKLNTIIYIITYVYDYILISIHSTSNTQCDKECKYALW